MKKITILLSVIIALVSCESYKNAKPNIQDKTSSEVNIIHPVSGNYVLLKDGSFFKISEGDFFIVNKK